MFLMGSEDSENQQPIHGVRLRPFLLCRYLVTAELWGEVMEDTPSFFRSTQRPVENVSWYSAVKFCNRLSGNHTCYVFEEEGVYFDPSAKGYRLPTEAEWEFAARGGNQYDSHVQAGSPELDQVSWYRENSGLATLPIGQKRPNSLGLYGMNGNVREWCWDWYDEDYYSQSPTDSPMGPDKGYQRVRRGGSWINDDGGTRITYRRSRHPREKSNRLGFRLARSV